MAGSRKPAPFPSDEQILEFIRDTDGRPGKREIARAFKLDAEQKRTLKKVLRRLQDDGTLQRGRRRRFHEAGSLPPVTVVEVTGTDSDGEVLARPVTWDEEDLEPLRIYMAPERRGQTALGPGDRVLARLTPIDPAEAGGIAYEGRTIRRLAGAPARVLGILEDRDGRAWIKPVDKRAKHDFLAEVPTGLRVKPGHLVWAEIKKGSRLGPREARVLESLGHATGPKSISLIAVHERDIPTRFSDQAWADAEAAQAAPMGERVDLRPLPLVTIDGADARDFDDVIAPLYGAYAALERNRRARGVLDLDLPERRITLDDKGRVTGIEPRQRLDSHKLIEEFMICANVAAAETLEKMAEPCMYRIHDQPSKDKLESLRQFLDSLDVRFARGQVIKPAQFNRILEKFADTPHSHMVSEVVLRSQSQAEYGPENIGHFGLALRRYCHFTSPIRRYADLLVHRALIRGGRLGEGGLEKQPRDFAEMGEHISITERRAAMAERDAVDRFTAAFLADRVGATFQGRITGVTRFGLFVRLEDSGGDGLIPIGSLGEDYFVHEEARHALVGRDTGIEYRLGSDVGVILREAEPVTGGLILDLESAASPRRTGSRPPRRLKSKRADGKKHGKRGKR